MNNHNKKKQKKKNILDISIIEREKGQKDCERIHVFVPLDFLDFSHNAASLPSYEEEGPVGILHSA